MAESKSDDLEVEYQFEGDLERVERWLEAQPPGLLSIVRRPEVLQHDTYFDTEDWAINRARFTLRLRRKGDEAEATMKSFRKGGEGASRRLEFTQPLPDGATGMFDDDGSVVDRVRLLVGSDTLRPLFELKTRRLPFLIEENGRTIAELVLDTVAVFQPGAGEARGEISRIEVEEKERDALARIQAFVEALRDENGLQQAATSKYQAAMAAIGLAVPPLDFGPAEPSAVLTAGDYGLAVLRGHFTSFLRHSGGTRLGEDREELHDMRVGARRLRSALKTFAPVLAPEFAAFSERFKSAGRALGAVRDLDVQLEGLVERQASAGWEEANALAPLIERVRQSRAKARVELLRLFDDPAYDRLVGDFGEALRGAMTAEGDEPVTALAFGRGSLEKSYRKFRKEARALQPDAPADAMHAMRIRARKFRYRVESFEAIFGKRAERLVECLVALQDDLGELHDDVVSIDWLRRLAREDGHALSPATLILMGRMMEEKRASSEALRRDWPAERKEVRREWRSLRRALGRKESAIGESEIESVENIFAAPSTAAAVERRRWLSGFRRLPFAWRRSPR